MTHTLNFAIFAPSSVVVKTLVVPICKWKRQSRRTRFSFIGGGTDSAYLGFDFKITLKWELMDFQEYEALQTICSGIRSGYDVSVAYVGVYASSFMGANPFQYPFKVDLDDDEVLDYQQEYVPITDMEVTFIVKNPVTPNWGTIYQP
jgi:hypothetical protein